MDRDPDSSSSRATGDVQQPDPVLLEGYAQGCTPPNLQSWPVGPPRVPALQPGQKPNFIVILVDDQGYDDIGLHHPRGPDGVSSAGAQTPNLDKLRQVSPVEQVAGAHGVAAREQRGARDGTQRAGVEVGEGHAALDLKQQQQQQQQQEPAAPFV
uniref:Sulfatase N-terminal domain-containing protein n=1 Tax=Tetradesmus obliquus TaxID=3088 RepID=A0A383WL69_TETOB|eukprot:jgi/Sobl393_1/18267/SZX77864.1